MSALGVAAIAFIATDMDDILVLAALFADPTIRRRSIVLGQFLGIGALVGISYLAAQLAFNIPSGWVALLGFVPLLLGVMKLVSMRRAPVGDESDTLETATIREHRMEQQLRSQILAVAGITVANGGDNLGVYIPLFANSATYVSLYAAVFIVMTGLWCVLGYYAAHNPLTGDAVHRYGEKALPFVLIGLGIYILVDALVLFR